MPSAAQPFSGGFAEPVMDAQAAFRTLMDCMARPGLIGTLPPLARPPQPLGLAQGVIALCLADQDTPVHLTAGLAKTSLSRWLAFHAGARTTDDRATARFAFAEAGAPFPALSAFAKGTQDYPDRSTTIIAEIEALAGGRPLILTGPGIKGQTILAPKGLPQAFVALWAENRRLFPRGVDLILTAGADLVCLPRSVTIAGETA